MSNSSLENIKESLVKSSESKNNANKIEIDNVNSTLLNFTDNKDDSFENLCRQKSINDEESLQMYHDVAVTGKIKKNITKNIKI